MKQSAVALLLLTNFALAAPPLNPDAAIAWADETVTTAIPKEERLYVLGPETRTEPYLLDGKPASHVVTVRRIVSAKKVRSLGDLGLTRFGKIPFTVQVYRAGVPVFATGSAQSDFSLQAGDLAVVRLGN